MPQGTPLTPLQRFIHQCGATIGLEKEKVDALLKEADLPPVKDSTWNDLVGRYRDYFMANGDTAMMFFRLREAISKSVGPGRKRRSSRSSSGGIPQQRV